MYDNFYQYMKAQRAVSQDFGTGLEAIADPQPKDPPEFLWRSGAP
jgi:hypothetical protein